MAEYIERATIHNLDRSEFIWNPDFQAKMDDKGKWTGSESFTCRLKDVTRVLPTMGASCTLEGWEFLTTTSVSVQNIEGDLAQVTLNFSGYQEGNFTFDDNNLNNYVYDLQIQVGEQPIITHPKTIAPYGDMTQDEKNALVKVLTGEWKGNKTASIKKASSQDDKESLTFTTTDGIKFYDYVVNQGIESFYLPSQVWRISYTTKSRPDSDKLSDVGKIKKPKGAPNFGDDKNWLFQGLSISENDRVYTVTEEYLLSDIKGWDTYLYEDADAP